MFALLGWVLLALSCAGSIAGQDNSTLYRFTMSATNPAPVPGQPFTLTWTGGQPDEAVYIILNYYFPDAPNQNIIYGTTDILSNAPNNGSWTYNVPLSIASGRHSFSIGYNPFMLSDTSGIFTILPSQTSAVSVSSGSSMTNTAYQTYNGCGLPPLPDFTYTGYQPPCTDTVNGVVETLYPIVPATDSSSFFGNSLAVAATDAVPTPLRSTPTALSAIPVNTAFAPGIFAQALQCQTTITPSTTRITVSGVTTMFALVGCATASVSTNNAGVCHTSGYTTFSVSGTSSVCCPNGWATTPLNWELFCFTETSADVEKRQASTETLFEAPSTLVEIRGVAFTAAGVVTEASVTLSSTSSMSGSGGGSTTAKGSVASVSSTKIGGANLDYRLGRVREIVAVIAVLCYLV